MTKKVQEDTLIGGKGMTLDVEKIDDNNLIVTSTNRYGVMETRVFLFPKEIFE